MKHSTFDARLFSNVSDTNEELDQLLGGSKPKKLYNPSQYAMAPPEENLNFGQNARNSSVLERDSSVFIHERQIQDHPFVYVDPHRPASVHPSQEPNMESYMDSVHSS